MNIVSFHAVTDIVVIGTNPEAADMDNPRGELYGFASYVIAESARGDRRQIHIKTDRCEYDALEPAVIQARALTVRLAQGKMPIAFNSWKETRPAYGSEAYIEYGQANDLELEAAEE